MFGKSTDKGTSALVEEMKKLSIERRKSGKRGSSLKLKRMLDEEKDDESTKKKQKKNPEASCTMNISKARKLNDLKLKELEAFAGVHVQQKPPVHSSPCKQQQTKTPPRSPNKTPGKSTKKALLDSPRKCPVQSSRKIPVKSPRKPPLDSPRKSLVRSRRNTPVKSPRKPVDSPRKSPLRSSRKTPVKSPRKPPLDSLRKSPLRSSRKTPVKSPRKPPLDSPRKSPRQTPVQSHTKTRTPVNTIKSPTINLESSPIEATSFIISQGLGVLNENVNYSVDNGMETENVSKI